MYYTAYYLTCLEAAVTYIMQIQAPDETVLLADAIFGEATEEDRRADLDYELELELRNTEGSSDPGTSVQLLHCIIYRPG